MPSDIVKELEDQEPHPMTATERRELRSIIKGEFVVLKSELQDHLKDLVRQSDKQIEEEFAALQKESTKVGTKIRAELVKTMTKVKNIEQEFMDKNLEPSERISSNYYDYSDIELTSASVGIKFKSRWQPKNLQKRKDAAKQEIQRAYEKGIIQLDRREVDLLRKLSLDVIRTDTAVAFLQSIPKASELLYLDSSGHAELASIPASTGGDQ